MVVLAYTLVVVSMLAITVVLASALRRRARVPWLYFVVGMATFLGSQIVHLPLNNLLGKIGVIPGDITDPAYPLWRTALILGFTAGLCEELARTVGYAFLTKARRWADGVMLGLGHGGIEAMIVGVLTAAGASSLLALQGLDLGTLGLAAEQVAALEQQRTLFFGTPWLAAMPLVERLLAISLHVSLSLLVLEAFRKRNAWWVVAAIAYHTLADFAVVYAQVKLVDAWRIELVLAAVCAPAWLWLTLRWPRRQTMDARRTTMGQELRLLGVALGKELVQQWRTRRVLIVAAVLVMFGLMSPALAKFTPQLLGSIQGAEQFADLIPEPSMADAVAQFAKNTTQFGFMIALLLTMGLVAGEKERGQASMILSKPLPRWAFVISKFLGQAILYVGGMALATLGAWYYTYVLFEPIPLAPYLVIGGLMCLWLLVYVAVNTMASAISKSTGAAAGIGLLACIAVLLAGNIPQIAGLAPSALLGWAGQIDVTGSASIPANGGALAAAALVMVVSLLIGIGIFERQEL